MNVWMLADGTVLLRSVRTDEELRQEYIRWFGPGTETLTLEELRALWRGETVIKKFTCDFVGFDGVYGTGF